MARSGRLARLLAGGEGAGEALARVQTTLARTFADRSTLRLWGTSTGGSTAGGITAGGITAGGITASPPTATSADDVERGLWGLNEPPEAGGPVPLADRVEMEVVRALQRNETITLAALDAALCAQFAGLLAPSPDLLLACLESYAVRDAEGSAGQEAWRLRPEESPQARRAGLAEMRALVQAVGQTLGRATTEAGGLLEWAPAAGSSTTFAVLASSIISRYVFTPAATPPPALRVIVLPGSRARLLSYKLRRDPRLADAARGWRLLKFRQLRRIAAQPALTPDIWEAMLEEDPLSEEATQRGLFEIR
jgi:hypothetical protein